MVMLAHLREDAQGHSMWDEIELKMSGAGGPEGYSRRQSAASQDVESWQIGCAMPGHFVDFTPSGSNQFIAVFSGQMHITASNGEEKIFARGDMFCMQDIKGQGHMTRFTGLDPCNYLIVHMPGGFKDPPART